MEIFFPYWHSVIPTIDIYVTYFICKKDIKIPCKLYTTTTRLTEMHSHLGWKTDNLVIEKCNLWNTYIT